MNFEKCSHPCNHNYNKKNVSLTIEGFLVPLCSQAPSPSLATQATTDYVFGHYPLVLSGTGFKYCVSCSKSSLTRLLPFMVLCTWSSEAEVILPVSFSFLLFQNSLHMSLSSPQMPLLTHFLLDKFTLDSGHERLSMGLQCHNLFTSKFQLYYFF